MEIPSLQHTWTLKDNMFMGSFRKTKYCPLGESQTKTWNKGGSHQFAKRIRDQIVLLSLGVFCLCRLCPCSVQYINQKYHCLQSNQWQTVSESYARDGWCFGDFMRWTKTFWTLRRCNPQTEETNIFQFFGELWTNPLIHPTCEYLYTSRKP